MRPYGALCAFVAVSTTLAACGAHNGAAPPATSHLLTASSAGPSAAQGAPPVEAPTTTEPELISELVGFTSPSGNVGCLIASTTVRCDISDRAWSPPPRPVDCEFDYGQGIEMSPGGQASFVCAGDTALGGGQPLAYGKSLSAGALACDSAEAGITCRDTTTGHGFFIARESYHLF